MTSIIMCTIIMVDIMEDNINKKENPQKKYMIILIIIVSISFIGFFFRIFHIIIHEGKIILMFTSGSSTISGRGKSSNCFGPVIGNYTLKTEYGEIVLKNLARIEAENSPISTLGIFSLSTGDFTKITHNLVIDGQELPKNISIDFFYDGRISGVYFNDSLEMNVSNISIMVYAIEFDCPRGDYKDFTYSNTICKRIYSGRLFSEVTLADSTQIIKNIPEISLNLFQFDDTDKWELYAYTYKMYTDIYETYNYYQTYSYRQRNLEHHLLVQHPGESESTRYVSITFKKDWGDFIEGVSIEDDESVFQK